jgi:Ca2+-binding EF-hand superfamily protein
MRLFPRLLLALAAASSGLALGAGQSGARDRAAQGELPPAPIDYTEADRFFATADYDGNGWISFREARQALEIDQARFFAFDENRDGAIDLEEFRRVYAETVRKVGAFPPPKPDPSRRDALTRGLPAGGAGETSGGLPPARSVEELFGHIVDRESSPDAQPRPPRILGPVPVFRRLDFDDDGLISVQDLMDLARPLSHPVRVRALIADLDQDGDGGVSREEFRRAMQSRLPAAARR